MSLGNRKIMANNIRRLMNQQNKTQKDLTEAIGVSQSTLSGWVSGDYYPRIDNIERLANYFGVDKVELVEDVNKISNLITIEKGKRLPILGTISCGTPIDSPENIEGYFLVDSIVEGDYVLTAKGDSMIDEGINPGDKCFIKKQPVLENGEIGAIRIGYDDEVTLKKFYKMDDHYLLQPSNPKYQPIIIDSTVEVDIVGKLVGIYKKVQE